MGLLQNIAVLNAEPMTYIGAGGSGSPVVVASTQCMDLARVGCYHGKELNLFFSYADQLDSDSNSQLQKSGLPYGYTSPYQFVLAVKEGAMTTQTEIAGIGSMTAYLIKGGNIAAASPKIIGIGSLVANAYLGYYMQALAPKITGVGTITTSLTNGINLDPDDLLGVGSIDANQSIVAWWRNELLQGDGSISSTMQLPISMSSSIVGEGAVVANMVGLAILLAALEGDSTLSADFRAMAQLETGMTGDGDLVNPLLKCIAWCVADLLGEGTASGSIRSDGYMSANIKVSGDLVTAESCAAAVWNALDSAYNDEGTKGKVLSSAGSAGDPWTGLLASYNDDATFGAFVKKLLTTGKFIALK